MSKELMESVRTLSHQMRTINKETEIIFKIIKQKPLKLENITKMTNSLYRFSSRFEKTQQRTSDLKGKSNEICQPGDQTEKLMKKM